MGFRVSNDNVDRWDTKMTNHVKQIRLTSTPSLCISNKTRNDKEDKMAGGRDGRKFLEIVMMGCQNPEGYRAPKKEGAYYRSSEDGRWRPSSSAYLGLACRIYQGPEIKFSK